MYGPRLLSNVELYRRGSDRLVALDLEDAYDRAIFCAVQLYTDYLERLSLREGRREERERINLYETEELTGYEPEVMGTPHWLEAHLKFLRSVAAQNPQDRVVPPEELFYAAQTVAETLFAPEGSRSYRIPRDLWQAGEGAINGRPDTPANLTSTLAPIAYLLRFGFGELISQTEAARRLGLTQEGVRYRVREGLMRSVRVGGGVLVPTADFE